MSLLDYKNKRDFKNTSEPVARVASGKHELQFVIQRHDASHLHYDFRLELDDLPPEPPTVYLLDSTMAL